MKITPVTRRAALGQLAALLGAGIWPGALRAAETRSGGAGAVRFAVLNDLHHDSAECDAWFERLTPDAVADVDFDVNTSNVKRERLMASTRPVTA